MNYKISKIFKDIVKYRNTWDGPAYLNAELYDEMFILAYRIVNQLELALRDQIHGNE